MCALVKDKAAECFQPQQLGVACCVGAENMSHDPMGCIEEHWVVKDFAVLKVDRHEERFNIYMVLSLMSVLHFSHLGCLGAMGPILWYGTLLAGSASSQECSKETL